MLGRSRGRSKWYRPPSPDGPPEDSVDPGWHGPIARLGFRRDEVDNATAERASPHSVPYRWRRMPQMARPAYAALAAEGFAAQTGRARTSGPGGLKRRARGFAAQALRVCSSAL